jgi:PAB-dependent poly(A)-specific ribonuclease subunit 2
MLFHRPLNTVGMPYYRETLLSAWPSQLVHDVGTPPAKFDKDLMTSLKPHKFGIGFYGENTVKERRNEVLDRNLGDQIGKGLQPKFLSERARELASGGYSGTSTPPEQPEVAQGSAAKGKAAEMQGNMRAMYQQVEIKYSKFGVDDFDFG